MSPRRMAITRRSVLAGGVAVATVSLSDWLAAQPAVGSSPKRSEVGTPDGEAMLKLYRKAVAKMQGLPVHDPLSWQFQANIHDFPDEEPIDDIFALPDGASDDEKAAIADHHDLALGSNKIWRTCSHFGYPDHFLTWHRMYLYFFERIAEKVVGEPFALPYWSYLPGPDGARRLPDAFLSEFEDGERNPLWFEARNSDFVNFGIADARDVDHEAAFGERLMLPSASRDGFSGRLEDVPHGHVHVVVGTNDGMGNTPKAARDPIFWLHHSNIDRLWESWRQADPGGASQRDPLHNQDWSKHPKFWFAGLDGERVEMTLQEALAATPKLGVEYDNLEAMVVAMGFAGEPDRVAQATTLQQTAPAGSVAITKKGVPVTVGVAPSVAPPVALGFSRRPETRYDLIVDIETSAPPGALYDVIMRVPKAPNSTEMVDRVVGSFNLFAIGHTGGHLGHTTGGILTKTWKTEITDLVRQKLVDPTVASNVSFKARYADPAVPVTIKSVRVEAR